jgi:2-succinyl-5-enolpyruvyl-6-hydroxy-3-cyclohexene-1-carboxylate synthase
LPNLRIVVLNNHGGAIFSIIDGPSDLAEAEEYFVTMQKATARNLAVEYDFDYLKLDSLKKMKNLLKDFFEFDGRTKILEIETTAPDAKATLEAFKNQIRKNYEA